MECALPFPHVFCHVPSASVYRETLRAAALDWHSVGLDEPRVEGSLSPGEAGVVMVMWPGHRHELAADDAQASTDRAEGVGSA